jgi:Lactoylglutathione lyase and related lyases
MIRGIHHVTAIASDPQRNLDFYAGLLGLRLVKVTINYDDPGTYHFYYGDGLGRPGTILTFFPWPGASPARIGTGQVVSTNLSVPEGAVGWWRERLEKAGVTVEGDAAALRFADPDGMALVLTEQPGDARSGWDGAGIPADYTVRGVESVSLEVADPARSRGMLTETLGFRAVADGRLTAGEEHIPGAAVRVREAGAGARRGLMGAGAVHHVAFRVADNAAELAWRDKLVEAGYNVSPQMDRQYFQSIYFREPGGVLYEIATDGPGFTVDEPEEELGQRLCLPEWLEPQRRVIEDHLPRIVRPGVKAAAAAA